MQLDVDDNAIRAPGDDLWTEQSEATKIIERAVSILNVPMPNTLWAVVFDMAEAQTNDKNQEIIIDDYVFGAGVLETAYEACNV